MHFFAIILELLVLQFRLVRLTFVAEQPAFDQVSLDQILRYDFELLLLSIMSSMIQLMSEKVAKSHPLYCNLYIICYPFYLLFTLFT